MSDQDAARAAALFDSGRWGEARDAAARALRTDPRNGSARLTLAGALDGLGEHDAAFDEVTALVADDPENATALRLLAIVADRTGRPRRGLEAAKAAARVEPSAWQSHAILAFAEVHAHGGTGGDRAIAAAKRAVELAPDVASAHEALGTVFLLLGRHRQAEAALRVALEIDPNDLRARQNLGVALDRRGKVAAAMNLFAGLTAEQPANPAHTKNIVATFGRWVMILLVASLAWAMIGLRFPPPAPSGGGLPPWPAFAYALTLPTVAAIGLAVFTARFRFRLASLVTLLRREATGQIAVMGLLTLAFLLLLVGTFLSGMPRVVVLGAAVVVLLVAGYLAYGKRPQRLPKKAAAPLREEPRPLTFREDVARALSSQPAPRGLNGKPVLQPWAVGPGRIIGFVCSVISLVPNPAGIVIGLLGFVLSNTAWAHLRNADLPRRLPFYGQVLGAVGTVLGIASAIVLATIFPHR